MNIHVNCGGFAASAEMVLPEHGGERVAGDQLGRADHPGVGRRRHRGDPGTPIAYGISPGQHSPLVRLQSGRIGTGLTDSEYSRSHGKFFFISVGLAEFESS